MCVGGGGFLYKAGPQLHVTERKVDYRLPPQTSDITVACFTVNPQTNVKTSRQRTILITDLQEGQKLSLCVQERAIISSQRGCLLCQQPSGISCNRPSKREIKVCLCE